MPSIAQEIDGVSFALKQAHDFAWLHAYGRVLSVFDQQDSGNICFGVANGARRWFIKYAGAPTVNDRQVAPPSALANSPRSTGRTS